MDSKIFLKKLRPDHPMDIDVTESTDWVGDLLDELNDGLVDEEGTLSTPSFHFTGEMIKVQEGRFDEMATLTGELKTQFYAQCIKSGDTLLDELVVKVSCIFFSEDDQKILGDEEMTYYYKESEYDIFDYQRNNIDLKEALHEYIYLNKNPYPKLPKA